ncbi:signal peptide peptidase SppA [Acidihalobacter aeolianus]|uniref:Signal peptide peptidase SppA n=1 Tax=Acidihalobacter aeolianus TaxID=2792603 RepID=A0A1D8K4M3_9GAMM|nr:signal peptide peptidase SppA [Acidihalobacter aeolianus]AOV15903.1 signal peptide peptidase SppA [Acidihalobacter aeolianus]
MGKLMGLLRWIDRVLHGIRRGLLNLITLFVLLVIAFALFHAAKSPRVQHESVLVVAPEGHLVYSYTDSDWQRAINVMLDQPRDEVLIRSLTDAIDHAASDPRIKVMELNLNRFEGGSITQLETVADALARFRKAGKPIFAYAGSYSQGSYLLAAEANHVYMNPLGAVMIAGYGAYQPYFKTLLDRIGVTMYAFRKGKYKSAVEPMTRTDMSPAAREENAAWLQTWWSSYTARVAAARGLQPAQIEHYASQLPHLVDAAQGNTAKLAKQQGLVNVIGSWREFQKAVSEADVRPLKDTPRINYLAYDEATHKRAAQSAAVAVVPLDGMIVSGDKAVPGTVASGPTVEQLDRLLHDAAVHAVVLQVDSPGGSVDASEDIRSAVLRLRAAGKPVVVSMGTLAASGAYMISSAAQTLYAEPTTITADIGVFALVPNVSAALGKLGIDVNGIGTTPSVGSESPLMPLKPDVATAMQSHVDYLYHRFVSQVAQGRKLGYEQVDAVAQGRAWSGEAALRLKLIDHLGGIGDAIADAARLAHLKPGGYRVDYLPRAGQKKGFGALSQTMGLMAQSSLGGQGAIAALARFLDLPARELQDTALLLHSARPYGYFAYDPVTWMH